MKKSTVLTLSLLLLCGWPSAHARLVTKAVPYEQDGVQLEGYLAYDDEKVGSRQVPGVLLVHEWWGLNETTKDHAKRVAAMGYVAFAADMYGKGVTTEDPKKAGELAGQFYGKPLMALRAKAALDQLAKVPGVDVSRLAAIGFCFGGSTCQALAYSGIENLAGIVSFHGGPIPAPADVAGKIKTHFLLLNGAIDPMVKPAAKEELEKSLETAGIDYQSIDYSGAVHAFTNAGADKLAAEHDMVGMIAYNANAATRSWKQASVFFDEIFAKK